MERLLLVKSIAWAVCCISTVLLGIRGYVGSGRPPEHRSAFRWVARVNGGYQDPYLVVLPDGDVIWGGWDGGTFRTGTDAWLARISARGEVRWQRVIQSLYRDQVTGLARFPNGDILVTLVLSADLTARRYTTVWYMRMTPDGMSRWAYIPDFWGPDFRILDIVTAPDGTWYGIATFWPRIGGSPQIAVGRWSGMGHVIWLKHLRFGSPIHWGESIDRSPSGDLFITGTTCARVAGFRDCDLFVARLTPTGHVRWMHRLIFGWLSGVEVIRATPDDGAVLLGSVYLPGFEFRKPVIVKFDAAGHIEWARFVRNVQQGFGDALISLPNGGFLVVVTDLYSDDLWAVMLRLSARGELLWARKVLPADDRFALFRFALLRNTLYIVGETFVFSNDSTQNTWLIRTDLQSLLRNRCRILRRVYPEIDDVRIRVRSIPVTAVPLRIQFVPYFPIIRDLPYDLGFATVCKWYTPPHAVLRKPQSLLPQLNGLFPATAGTFRDISRITACGDSRGPQAVPE